MTVLKERSEMAKALNFGKYPVLTYNIDTNEGSKAIVIKKSVSHGDMRYRCNLYRNYKEEGDGIFYLLTEATMISAKVDVNDYLDSAEFANAPIIKPNTEVAILVYSELLNHCSVRIVKSGKTDPSYSTATVFN